MKAIRIHQPGGPEALQLDDVADPSPGGGQAAVKLAAAGVNYIDVYFRTGQYKAQLPLTLGLEGAGTVTAVGSGVSDVKAGDNVAWTGVPGSYAQMNVVPADRLVKLPAGVSAKDGAAAMLQGMTAHYLVKSSYPLKKGDTCLVHAAAGGMGLLLCQMAKMLGATVIGTVSTEEKAALAKSAGADHVILYTKQEFEPEVKRITGGRGVDVVYDGVGASTFDKSLNCLRPRGYMILFGAASGPVPPLDLQVINVRGSLFLQRPSLNHHIGSREELVQRAGEVLGWIKDGKVKLRIEHQFPLAQAAEAHRALEGRKTTRGPRAGRRRGPREAAEGGGTPWPFVDGCASPSSSPSPFSSSWWGRCFCFPAGSIRPPCTPTSPSSRGRRWDGPSSSPRSPSLSCPPVSSSRGSRSPTIRDLARRPFSTSTR